MARLIELDKQYRDIPEIAGTFLENNKTDEIENRINPYILKFNDDGEPGFECEKETELGKAEYIGMKNVWNLAKTGYKYIFWLSPEGGRSNYDQGRICIGIVKNNEQVELECRGIPVLVTANELLEMGNRIIKHSGENLMHINEPEDLREKAIGINLKSDEELWKLCEFVFGMKKVWQAIIRGDDIKKKEELIDVINTVLPKVRSIYKSFNPENSIESGAFFEREMKIRGYEMVGGNHGDLNTSFDKLFSSSEISVQPEIRNGKKYCPCGAEIKEGMTVCPDCGLKISTSAN